MKNLDLHFCIDGLGWEIAKRAKSFDFLRGTHKELETVLGFSSSAIPSILTGKQPQDHGMWNLFKLNPSQNDFPIFKMNHFFPKWINRNRYLRKSQLIANKMLTNFKGYYQAYNYPSEDLAKIQISESRNLYSLGGVPGSESIFDFYQKNQVNNLVYSYKTHSTQSIFKNLESDIQKKQPEKVFVYIADFDAYGHARADDMNSMIHEANSYGEKIHKVYKRLQNYGWDVNLSIFSDHGMVPLKEEVDIFQKFDTASLKYPSWIIDSTMVRIYTDGHQLDSSTKELISSFPGKWLDRHLLHRYFVDFKGEYGDHIFVLDSGYQFSPSHMGRNSCPGMHGYLPEDNMMKACFMSTKKYVPNHIIDLNLILKGVKNEHNIQCV